MSWEPVDRDAFPGQTRGGAFRGASEPLLAERRGISTADALRLFWNESPDLPARRVAARVVLTAAHVYVERRDGSCARVPRERLAGRRREGPVEVFGVVEDEDLFLVLRPRCPVAEALRAQLGSDAALERARGQLAALAAAAVLAAVGAGILAEYRLEEARRLFAAGLHTAETVLGVAAGFAALAVGVLVLLWAPTRTRVDGTGVERARGVFPWLRFRRAPEEIADAFCRPQNGYRNGLSYVLGVGVHLRLARRGRFGTLLPVSDVRLDFFPVDARGQADAQVRANALVEHVRRHLGKGA